MTSLPRPGALLIMHRDVARQQYGGPQRTRLERLAELVGPGWAPSLDDPSLGPVLGDVEVLITGWGAPPIRPDQLARVPRLRAILHSAGTVRSLVCDEVWQRGIRVSTSADLNADPVAFYTVAAVIMAAKKAPFLAADARRDRDWSSRGRRGPLSVHGLTVGVVGYSRVGRRVVAHLSGWLGARVLVCDPYADPLEVAASGGELVELDATLPQLDVLSLHVPDLPETRHLIGVVQLAALRDHVTVINTARGAVLDTMALERECVTGRLHAILDVTDPEPLPSDSPLYDCPGVMITPHLSGSEGVEVQRLSDGVLDELERLVGGRALLRQVVAEELSISA